MVDEGEGEERVARFFGVGGDDSVVASQVSGWDSGEVELDLRRREKISECSRVITGGRK